VRLEALRQRDSIRANAQLFCFLTPVRWLWPDWTNYLKEGPEGTTYTVPTVLNLDSTYIGIGGDNSASVVKFFEDNYLRVYNEWFKWPEAADATSVEFDGNRAVPLPAAWSRVRDIADPDAAADYTVNSATSFDVRDLVQKHAQFKIAMNRDVLSFDRY